MSEHHHHDHSHGHAHAPGERHPFQPDDDDTLTYPRRLEIALRELLIEKNVITADEVRSAVEDMDARTPMLRKYSMWIGDTERNTDSDRSNGWPCSSTCGSSGTGVDSMSVITLKRLRT